MGYTIEWIASELGVSPRTIHSWVAKGLLRGPGKGCGAGCRYSSEFVYAARRVHQWLQLYPRGPLENLRDHLHPEPDDEEDAA